LYVSEVNNKRSGTGLMHSTAPMKVFRRKDKLIMIQSKSGLRVFAGDHAAANNWN